MAKDFFTEPENSREHQSVTPQPRRRAVGFWMGQPLDELSKDKLLEIVEYLGAQLAEARSPQNSRAKALGFVEMIKRGETSHG